jgi:hypothetical protein
MSYRITVRFATDDKLPLAKMAAPAHRDFEDRKEALAKWEELLWRRDVTQVRVYEIEEGWKKRLFLKCWANTLKGVTHAV